MPRQHQYRKPKFNHREVALRDRWLVFYLILVGGIVIALVFYFDFVK